MKSKLNNVRRQRPLVHNITNYVTVNDCANILLACGASPIMSDAANEVEEITAITSALNINIGTLNSETIQSMLKAGKKARELCHPIVLDPVGAGASRLRTDTARMLIDEIKPTILRGNMSEIKALATGASATKGVDADISDIITNDNIDFAVEFAKQFAGNINAVVAITGAIDIVTDGNITYSIYNGNKMMSSVTGTGCQLSAMTAAFIAANTDDVLTATASAVITMGIAGEIAYERLTEKDGNASYRNYIIDAIYHIDDEIFTRYQKYEIK